MDATEANIVKAVEPALKGTDHPANPPVFSGTITSIKREKGVQTLEVQYSQGRIRLQADGDFQAGDKVRVSFPGGNAVELAKGGTGAAQGDPQGGVSYTLPQNVASLHAFEEDVVQWMANLGSAAGSPAGSPAATSGQNVSGQGGTASAASLARMTLPELLMQVMAKPGGKDFLTQAMSGLDRNTLGALAEAIDQTQGDPAVKSGLLDLIRSQGRGPEASAAETARLQAGAAGPKNLDGYWPAESGAGASPWFGQVLEKDNAEANLSPRDRLQFGGTTTTGVTTAAGLTLSAAGNMASTGTVSVTGTESAAGTGSAAGIGSSAGASSTLGAGAPLKSDPMYRYLLDVGGRTMEVYSSQSMEKGDLTNFSLETHGGRMQAKFLDPAQSLPADLRADFAKATPTLRQAMQLSSRYLQEFKSEPYFGNLVRDFSQVLAQSGRLDPAASGSAADAAASQTRPPGLPDPKELDGLLRLFVAFPRDSQQPEKQARIWGDAVRNPQAMMDLLKTLRPDQDTSLLRPDSGLHLAKSLPSASALSLPGENATEVTPEAVAGWLKKLLPESFKSSDLLNLAKQLADDSSASAAAAGKDHDPSKFLLQSVMNSFPKDDEMSQGKPSQFYFYQDQQWGGLRVTWEKGRKEASQTRTGPKEPLKVRVETQAKHMGKVNVGVTWDPKGAKLDFKNQFHDVRELLGQSLPELQKSLEYLDFKVTAWTYDLLPVLPEDSGPGLQSGWMRGSVPSDGANLDLFG